MPSESRDFALFVDDIAECADIIVEWTASLSMEAFLSDRKTFDAVLRNLTLMGEAAKHVPAEFRAEHPAVPWREIAAFRDMAMHAYFNLRPPMVWDIVRNHVPEVRHQLGILRRQLAGEDGPGV